MAIRRGNPATQIKTWHPFCVSTSSRVPEDVWRSIKHGDPNPGGNRGTAGTDAYDSFRHQTNEFAKLLDPIVDSISTRAQQFYDQHFADDASNLKLSFKVTSPPSFAGTNQATTDFRVPVIELGIQLDGRSILRPQSFLNEAKMTQLALSIRFAASLVNLHQSDVKLLVLDDLLVSLDMSNRMKVVEILMSPTFKDFQKIILTHELGLFQELRRHIGSKHGDWNFVTLRGNAKENPQLNIAKSDLEIAQDYLTNDQLAECGTRLRKCVETILEQFLNVANEKKSHDQLLRRGGFASLELKINEAKAYLCQDTRNEFAELLQGNFTIEEFSMMLSEEGIDHSKITETNKQKKGKIIAKLLAAREQLQNSTLHVLTDGSRKQLNAVRLLNEVKKIKDRILNPASHAGVTPLYSKEAEDAIKIIQQLQVALDAALLVI